MSERSTTEYAVSLVVPIYNVETYIEECLNSIAAQTMFDRIEVILVDDGSTDSSAMIARLFAEANGNVKLISRKNGGLGAARNTGVDAATSPLIAFLDSDDVLPPSSIEDRFNTMTDAVDIVVGDMRSFPKTTRWPWSNGIAGENRVLSGIADFPELLSNASACNKLFRTADLRDLRFEEGAHFEDAFVVVPLLLRATTIVTVSTVVYLYRKRETAGSIMDSLFDRTQNFWDHLILAERVKNFVDALDAERRHVADLFLVRSMQGFLLRAPSALEEQELTAYFIRARNLFSDVSPQRVFDATHNLHHRVAFAALAMDRLDVFADRWSVESRLTRRAGVMSLEIAPNLSDEWLRVLEVIAPRLYVENIDARDGSFRFSGRLDLPGVPSKALGANVVGVRLAHRGRLVSETSTVRVRRASSLYVPTATVEWEVPFSAQSAQAGRNTLDAHVLLMDGQLTIRVRAALGLQRAARTIRCGGFRLLPVPEPHDRFSVLLQPESLRFARLRWALRLLRDDLRAVRHRMPLASLRGWRAITRPFYRGRSLWLIGERSDTAQDNGYRFFCWLRENAPDVRARYVLKRGTMAWRSIGSRKGVLAHSGLRHRLAVLHAEMLVSSHDIDAYMLPRQWDAAIFRRHLGYRLNQSRVFLQHGVTFKDVAAVLAREVTGVRVFVVSTDEEMRYLAENARYTDELVLTGMPRFDTLVRTPQSDIVLMPTWRKYLVLPSYSRDGKDPGTFEGSEYQQFYDSLLNDPRLLDMLRRYDQTLTFMPHYEVAPHFRVESASHRIRVAPPHGDVQARIRSASILVSDYSSVMFDAAYAGIPVLQIPFDMEAHSAGHYGEGWFENDGGEYWPIAKNIDDVLDTLERMLAAGAVVDSRYEDKLDGLFPHRDQGNSRRVYNAIKAARDRR